MGSPGRTPEEIAAVNAAYAASCAGLPELTPAFIAEQLAQAARDGTVIVTQCTVTPKTGGQALARQVVPSRRVNWRHVEELARELAAHARGKPTRALPPLLIAFLRNGALVTGQHDLHAIALLMPGVPVPCEVRFGLDPDPNGLIDSGRT